MEVLKTTYKAFFDAFFSMLYITFLVLPFLVEKCAEQITKF